MHKQNEMSQLKAFVTVGTTKFDALIRSVTDERTLFALRQKGYQHVTLQIGRGEFVPPGGLVNGVELTHFRLKPSIAHEFESADLVISHAGAGSCIEALEKGKILIAVVNEGLMDNHQRELADELASNGYCYSCTPDTLQQTITGMDPAKLRRYECGNPGLLNEFLDSVVKVRV